MTDAPTDACQLRPLLDQVRQATGGLPGQYSADSGYWSEENVADLERRGIDAYIPPPRPRRRNGGTIPDAAPTPRKARMQGKLATPAGTRIYSRRKETAEPVFGQLKDGRGLRRSRTRGLAKVRGERALWCATHNLRKLAWVLRGHPRAPPNRPPSTRRGGGATGPHPDPRAPDRPLPPSEQLLSCSLPPYPDTLLVAGDSSTVLGRIPGGVFQSCITSPPYWSLRGYHIPGQIGLEPSLSDYLANLAELFSEVCRVLRDAGTLWLNIGDSYTSGGQTWWAPDKKNHVRAMSTRPPTPDGLKAKDLIGVPWRLAFALQEAGWYLRTDIIWNKPNCQPESVKDRPTRIHEYIFLFSKSEQYAYHPDAVRGPNGRNSRGRITRSSGARRRPVCSSLSPRLYSLMWRSAPAQAC